MSELQELIDASDAMVADNEHRQVNTRGALLGQIKKLSDTLKHLQSENEALRKCIKSLKCGDCWCEMGIGNPMMSSHSAACERARKLTGEGDD